MTTSHLTFKSGSRLKVNSAEEMIALGRSFGQELPENAIVALIGDLGAGKTTFVKGLAQGICGCSTDEVVSPTFTYLNIYEGNRTLYHFDLYRLESPQAFSALGFDDFLEAGGITCIEWADQTDMPQNTIHLTLTHTSDGGREIRYG